MNDSCKNIQDDGLDLRQLFFSIMREWRKMVVWMLIMAVFVGGVRFALGMQALLNEEEVQKRNEEYENLLAYNEQLKVASRTRMLKISAQVVEQKRYIDESIYMNINSEAVNRAEVKYFVMTDYEIIPSMVYQNIDRTNAIVDMFVTLLTNEDYLNKLAEQLNIELRYIQEIIDVRNDKEGVLSIEVMADSVDKSQTILEYLMDGVDANKDLIQSTIEKFTLSEISHSSYQISEPELRESQQEQEDKLSELMNAYSEEQKNYETLERTIVQDNSITSKSILKATIKFAIIGACVGFLIVCCFGVLKFVSGNVLYSTSTLKDKIGISIIGACSNSGKKYGKFDRWVREHEERRDDVDVKTASQLTAAYIKNIVGDNGSVLITGQAPEETISLIVKEVSTVLRSVRVIDGGHILSNPTAVSECANVDGVVLVEQCNLSKYSDITNEIEIVQRFDKQIVGCFVLED